MNCLFLCPRLAGYFHNGIRVLVESEHRAQVRIIAKPSAPNAPFKFEAHERIQIQSRAEIGAGEIDRVIGDFEPDYIYLGGWGDPLYRKIGRRFRRHIPVVMGMDNQWKGTFKQQVMSRVLRPWVRGLCNHILIPGLYQYEYARRLGFLRSQIITGMYSADCERFWKMGESRDFGGSTRRLLFIGNMWRDKGVVELVDAFNELADEFPDARLTMVGGGPLVDVYRGTSERIEVLGFIQPEAMTELIGTCHAFCLPSYHDAWAVVIHEACCMGLPVVATDVCGAVSAFVHDGYNGFRCAPRDKDSLKRSLHKLLSLSTDELATFGRRSRLLSGQITPEKWAASVRSLL